MTVEIKYRRPHSSDETTLEWVVPNGWGNDAIKDAFAFQYGTHTEILSITPKP
jgi:hypothetical protein